MKNKALITGVTGMVGSHLADFLLANTDWDIYGMCRWRSQMDNLVFIDVPLVDRVFLDGAEYFDYDYSGDYSKAFTLYGVPGGHHVVILYFQSASPIDPPEAAFTAQPNPVRTVDLVEFDASGSQGDIELFIWDFGDGGFHASDTSPLAAHGFDLPDPDNATEANYTVTLTWKCEEEKEEGEKGRTRRSRVSYHPSAGRT